MTPIPLDDPGDPRIAAYRQVRERDLIGRQGLFVAEGEVVLRRLLGPHSRFRTESVLIAENRVAALADLIWPSDTPVYVAAPSVMDQIVGFPIHRGVLAIGEARPAESAESVAGAPAPTDRVLAVAGVGNHDNMGGLFRAAAAFGVRAVVLDATCCDPLYRKAIRVSVGASLIVPFVRTGPKQDVAEVLTALGYQCLALTPSAEETLRAVGTIGATAIIVGAEGPGLPEATMARCRRIGIPMADGFDSLNVATAAAIALHHLAVQP